MTIGNGNNKKGHCQAFDPVYASPTGLEPGQPRSAAR